MSDERWLRRAGRLVVCLGILAPALLVGPADASVARPRQAEPSDEALLEADGVDPILDEVDVVDDAATRRADERVDERAAAESGADRARRDADQARLDVEAKAVRAGRNVELAQEALLQAQVELARQREELEARQAVTDRRRAVLDDEQARLRELAVSAYMAKAVDDVVFLGTYEDMSAGERRQSLRGQVNDDQTAATDSAERAWRTARGASRAQQRRVDRRQDDVAKAEGGVKLAVELRDNLIAFQRKAESTVAARQRDLDDAKDRHREALLDRRKVRLLARVSGLDMPLVALHAYWRAAAVAPCAIPWWLLAGVGKVETGHGTAHGAELQVDGTTSTRILGIPLDGRAGVARVGDSDGGTLDGDAGIDRAVGPMQFIPSTWKRWALDGNGDGKADPHNLYDAAAAAGNYLCFGRPNVTDPGTIVAALLSYNHSIPYGTKVLQQGHDYRDRLDLPDVPPADDELGLVGG